ncbi:hypothetical protein F9L33_04950 [Amylibacter sp. SFDW26]|uniref:hypothetical protein n=1 Tax=Amylibacter sp. SFDW26 TaxID=2652722 RepID=UPI0012617A65|nr:hypothetical protein [Amylibacter sp. SFDW26]KAB7616112.1 hypothetical protein F9L33_04950 [Amylibacter sp. SFDW26]
MALSIWDDVVRSVTKTSFTSIFVAIAIIRLGMMAYPTHDVAPQSQTSYQVEEGDVEIADASAPVEAPNVKTIAKDAPRIVFGQNSIESLKNRN